ncbi:hypothetical protein CLCR_09202 [Cladophialophora carrionii]|uniref:Uncharacterized protein n=1 Tax=Cladophialophora carrionii TaxID=86049 RepID=A0A1C1CUY9_9EURO|nr:hypothetical protein CLCR_09202 [Cladophialophora carrionii]
MATPGNEKTQSPSTQGDDDWFSARSLMASMFLKQGRAKQTGWGCQKTKDGPVTLEENPRLAQPSKVLCRFQVALDVTSSADDCTVACKESKTRWTRAGRKKPKPAPTPPDPRSRLDCLLSGLEARLRCPVLTAALEISGSARAWRPAPRKSHHPHHPGALSGDGSFGSI